jgi:hypothetical protein
MGRKRRVTPCRDAEGVSGCSHSAPKKIRTRHRVNSPRYPAGDFDSEPKATKNPGRHEASGVSESLESSLAKGRVNYPLGGGIILAIVVDANPSAEAVLRLGLVTAYDEMAVSALVLIPARGPEERVAKDGLGPLEVVPSPTLDLVLAVPTGLGFNLIEVLL